jgi:tryptophan-rich sensory protein
MSPLTSAVVICAAAAVLEGFSAGKNVRRFFAEIRQPKYSVSLVVWSVIGGLYYAVFGFVLYRLFALTEPSSLRIFAIVLIVVMMVLNGVSNWVIFRARDLRSAFLIGALFPALDLVLLSCLLRLDATAARALIPYLIYRVYGLYWGYALWKANPATHELDGSDAV